MVVVFHGAENPNKNNTTASFIYIYMRHFYSVIALSLCSVLSQSTHYIHLYLP